MASKRGGTLLVASTGGHLDELYRLSTRLTPALDRVEWATFDDAQSRSLLASERVHHVGYIAPRNGAAVLANLPTAAGIIRSGRYDRVVSTGSAIALTFLPLARMHGMQCHYIESAARAEAPSVTGSLVSRIPGVRLYTQYSSWATRRWNYQGSLFDAYQPTPRIMELTARNVVITLGTMRTYGFRRAIDAVLRVLPAVTGANSTITWQVGVTDTDGTGVVGHELIPSAEIKAAIADADLVIAHAGIGSALTALDLGKCPVLLPRRREHGEHVDDHQLMIARDLDRRGLAVSRDPEALDPGDLFRAMSRSIATSDQSVRFRLAD